MDINLLYALIGIFTILGLLAGIKIGYAIKEVEQEEKKNEENKRIF